MINTSNGLSRTMYGALAVAAVRDDRTVQLSPSVSPSTLRAIWNNGWGTLNYARYRDENGRIVRKVTGAKLSRLGLTVYRAELDRRQATTTAHIPAPRRSIVAQVDPFAVIATGRRELALTF